MDTTAAGTPAPMTPPAQQSATASANAAPAPTLKAPAPDEVAAVMPENAGNRNPQGDKYKQEVASLLDAYEAKQARVSAEREAERQAKPPEPEGLREGGFSSPGGIFNQNMPAGEKRRECEFNLNLLIAYDVINCINDEG